MHLHVLWYNIITCVHLCSNFVLISGIGTFIEIPKSQSISVGETAEFRCRHNTTIVIRWRKNGKLISDSNLPPDITPGYISGGSKLTIVGRLEYDGTEVVCVAMFDDESPDELSNPPAVLRGMQSNIPFSVCTVVSVFKWLYHIVYTYSNETYIIESVDSISRDGPDTPICIIHYKKTK